MMTCSGYVTSSDSTRMKEGSFIVLIAAYRSCGVRALINCRCHQLPKQQAKSVKHKYNQHTCADV
jgi:hypothetical protein